jgi:hypothetical protein
MDIERIQPMVAAPAYRLILSERELRALLTVLGTEAKGSMTSELLGLICIALGPNDPVFSR